MASNDVGLAVYIGNLKKEARILDLKASLYHLIYKVLKVKITLNDISIINGVKRYAVVEVHHQQNVNYLLERLTDYENRLQLKFNFLSIVDRGVSLHVDTVKSNDDKQAKDDFENAKNRRPYQKSQVLGRGVRPDFGKVVPLRLQNSVFGTGRTSRGSNTTKTSISTMKGGEMLVPVDHSTDLDVTLEDNDRGPPAGMNTSIRSDHIMDSINKPIVMVPVTESVVVKDESDDSGTQMEQPTSRYISPIESDDADDDEPRTPEYEDPPGSVIDLRLISRASMRPRATPRTTPRTVGLGSVGQGLVGRGSQGGTPRTGSRSTVRASQVTVRARTPQSQLRGSQVLSHGHSRSSSRKDLFEFLDRQIGGDSPTNQVEVARTNRSYEADEGTPYYRPGERIFNPDKSKEFRAFSNYTVKKVTDMAARCVCGYMNSCQRGTILLGVDADGSVVGIPCDVEQEERYQRHLLDAIKSIQPPVFEEEYSLYFSPLLEYNGRQHPSLKVIEIRVFPPGELSVLYSSKEGVFIRRKGVLTGPIRPQHIQAWVYQKHQSELDELRDTEAFMKDEMERKDLMIRRQADTIMAQRSEIDQKNMLIDGSRTCTIL